MVSKGQSSSYKETIRYKNIKTPFSLENNGCFILFNMVLEQEVLSSSHARLLE